MNTRHGKLRASLRWPGYLEKEKSDMKKTTTILILTFLTFLLIIGSAAALTPNPGSLIGITLTPISEVFSMLVIGFSMIGLAGLGRKSQQIVCAEEIRTKF